jgi:hypothetical protein
MIVGFAGLPSAGKSTMINALAGKRVLQSGVCRTTTEVCIVGAKRKDLRIPGMQAKFVQADLRSDDGVEFYALDLPGVCDAEDIGATFDSATIEWAAKCSVVAWVTDARTAFLTNHEVAALGRVRAAIQRVADDGALCQLVVVLSKYDVQSDGGKKPIALLDGEIGTGTEDSTIEHCVDRVSRAMRMFEDSGDVRVTTFNAFDRILRDGSEALRALVPRPQQRTPAPNILPFDLLWATEGLVERRLALLTRVLRETRLRATAAESSVISLTSRLAKARVVYDSPFEFLFVRHNRDAAGHVTSETTVFSLPVMMDLAVDDAFLRSIGQGTLRTSPGSMHFETGESYLNRSIGSFTARQLVVPPVRPEYGDVFVVPSTVTSYLDNGNLRVKGTNAHFGVCTGVGSQNYVLKVGEASRAHLQSLVAAVLNADALAPQSLVVRCIKL